jgi:hypothetical protein
MKITANELEVVPALAKTVRIFSIFLMYDR